jgi:transcriptional regulator with XRE-family HTH domain
MPSSSTRSRGRPCVKLTTSRSLGERQFPASAMNFVKRLKKLRTDAGLTQVDLADRTGIHLGALDKLESGEQKPTWREVQLLCKALGVSVSQEPAMWRLSDPWSHFRFRNRLGCLLQLGFLPTVALLVPLAHELFGRPGPLIVAASCLAAAAFGMFYRGTALCPRCKKTFYAGVIGFFPVHFDFAWKCMNCGIPKYLAFDPENPC